MYTTDNPSFLTGYPFTVVLTASIGVNANQYIFTVGTETTGSPNPVFAAVGYRSSPASVGVSLRCGGTTRTLLGVTNGWVDRGKHTAALVARTDTDYSAWVSGAGATFGTDSPGTTFEPITHTIFGARSETGASVASAGSVLYWATVYDRRALTDSELSYLTIDPYCFLRPVIRRSYGFVGAAAGLSIPVAMYHYQHH